MRTAVRKPIKAERVNLIKRYHTLASVKHMTSDDREVFLEAWGVTSSTELTDAQLESACRILARMNMNTDENKWRKRVLAVIGAYLSLTGRDDKARAGFDYIKAIACNAAKHERFNDIPVDKLRAIYASFGKYNKVLKATGEMIDRDLETLICKN